MVSVQTDLLAHWQARACVWVLIGPAGCGKTTWATAHFAPGEVISSDALRAATGTGAGDLDASGDAFAALDLIARARARRGLTLVLDTTGLDVGRRNQAIRLAHDHGLPCVAVIFTTPLRTCKERNRSRDRSVPAGVVERQWRQTRATATAASDQGFDAVLTVDTAAPDRVAQQLPASESSAAGSDLRYVLQLSRFPSDQPLGPWVAAMAQAAEQVGFHGLALMDHLIQIPQVGRPFEAIPAPWTTLGYLAAATDRLALGTLVSPVTFHHPGVLAKTVATLDSLSGGRAFLGLGAGWWQREHLAYRLPFPGPGDRLTALSEGIALIRALLAPGTKPYQGKTFSVPETTCYPRPVGSVPILVGGTGRRLLRIAATLADGCNLPTRSPELPRMIAEFTRHRDGVDGLVTVLDVPVIGRTRADLQRRVEGLRGRVPAAEFATRNAVGTIAEHRRRHEELGELGVSMIFLAPQGVTTPEDLYELAELLS